MQLAESVSFRPPDRHGRAAFANCHAIGAKDEKCLRWRAGAARRRTALAGSWRRRKRVRPACGGHTMANARTVKTVKQLLARAAKQEEENVGWEYHTVLALQLIADVLIAILAELQAQKPKRAGGKK